jgi:hypothetical protein
MFSVISGTVMLYTTAALRAVFHVVNGALELVESVQRLGDELDDRNRGLIPVSGQKCFLSMALRPAVGSTQPPLQWVSRSLTRGSRSRVVKLMSPPCSAEVKNSRADFQT